MALATARGPRPPRPPRPPRLPRRPRPTRGPRAPPAPLTSASRAPGAVAPLPKNLRILSDWHYNYSLESLVSQKHHLSSPGGDAMLDDLYSMHRRLPELLQKDGRTTNAD